MKRLECDLEKQTLPLGLVLSSNLQPRTHTHALIFFRWALSLSHTHALADTRTLFGTDAPIRRQTQKSGECKDTAKPRNGWDGRAHCYYQFHDDVKFSSALDDRYDIKVNENRRVPLYICFAFEQIPARPRGAPFYFVRLVAVFWL